MIKHLADHQKRGDKVPVRAIQRLMDEDRKDAP
jgi:hypothetical protein